MEARAKTGWTVAAAAAHRGPETRYRWEVREGREVHNPAALHHAVT